MLRLRPLWDEKKTSTCLTIIFNSRPDPVSLSTTTRVALPRVLSNASLSCAISLQKKRYRSPKDRLSVSKKPDVLLNTISQRSQSQPSVLVEYKKSLNCKPHLVSDFERPPQRLFPTFEDSQFGSRPPNTHKHERDYDECSSCAPATPGSKSTLFAGRTGSLSPDGAAGAT